MPCIQSFYCDGYGPGKTLRILVALMTFIGCLCIFLNIYAPEINYKGLWGLSNLVFGVLVGLVFYVGTKFDPREEPTMNLLSDRTTESIRFWTCLAQTISMILLNIIQFYLDYSDVLNATRAFMTVISILVANWMKMDLMYREIGEDFSIGIWSIMIFYTIVGVFFVISYLIRSNTGSDMRDFLAPLLYFFSYIQWVFIAALISGIYREAKVPANLQQHVEEVVVPDAVVPDAVVPDAVVPDADVPVNFYIQQQQIRDLEKAPPHHPDSDSDSDSDASCAV